VPSGGDFTEFPCRTSLDSSDLWTCGSTGTPLCRGRDSHRELGIGTVQAPRLGGLRAAGSSLNHSAAEEQIAG